MPLGLLFASWGGDLLVKLESQSTVMPIDIRTGRASAGVHRAVSIASGLIFGLAPAWKTTRLDVVSSLKTTKSGQADGFTRVFSKLLIVSQVVFSVVLMVLAGLFLRTLANLENVTWDTAAAG